MNIFDIYEKRYLNNCLGLVYVLCNLEDIVYTPRITNLFECYHKSLVEAVEEVVFQSNKALDIKLGTTLGLAKAFMVERAEIER